MAIKIVKSNASGFPSPAIPSRYNDVEGASMPLNTIEGVYENGPIFSIDIAIQEEIQTTEIAYVNVPVTQILSSNYPSGINVTKISDKIRISGSPSQVFTNSYYEFLMEDRSVKVLPANTTEPILAITRWSPPSIKYIYDVPYNITLKYMSSITSTEVQETVTILQDVYWDYGVGVQGFRDALSKGKI